jgi:hypothetical protein
MTAQPVAADNQRQAQASSSRFQTTRTFELDASRAARTFTFRERSGVILVNRLTVPHGVRAFVDARIPHLAGARESQAGRAATARGVRKLGRMDCRGILNPWRPARPPQLCIAADKGFQRLRERLPVISQCSLGVADHDESWWPWNQSWTRAARAVRRVRPGLVPPADLTYGPPGSRVVLPNGL